MNWRDQIQKPHFRNVPFELTDFDIDTGRRGQLHEYANRDTPYFEDLGRKGRSFTFEAFVIGDDYFAKRDALIAACEEAGLGTLRHPALGTLEVANIGCRVSETNKELGVARFSLTFVEAGELKFPVSTINTKAATYASSAKLHGSAKDYFLEEYSIDKQPSFVSESVHDTLNGWLDTISPYISNSHISESIAEGQSIAKKAVKNALGLQNTVSSVTAALREGNNLALLSQSSLFTPLLPTMPFVTKTRLQQAKSLKAIGTLIRFSAIAEEGVAIVNTDFDSYQDAIGKASEYANRIENEITTGPANLNSTLYNSLSEMSEKVVSSVRSSASGLARLTTVSSPDPQPALVTSYRLWGDASRDSEIIDRNNIIHPSFLPPATELEVLNR
ncbi:MAG: DNA circularization N-terminal domain-containing protein [Sneathiella sp.]